MNEREWLESVDRPRDMIEEVVGASNRKWRLFGCACYRRVWDLLGERARHRVIIAEDYADINHCRGPRPHVRGCWVVDLLLGKS